MISLYDYEITDQTQTFYEHIEDLIKENRFELVLAERILGEYAIPDYIYEVANDIKDTHVPKDFSSILESSDSSTKDEEGPSLINGALGITKSQARKFLKDPKTASVLFRSLRDKLEEMEYKKDRAKAEDHGFIAMVIFTIKRAIMWLVSKFKDIRDDFLDMMADRPAGASRTKRDYNYVMSKQRDYLIKNTDWYVDSEY